MNWTKDNLKHKAEIEKDHNGKPLREIALTNPTDFSALNLGLAKDIVCTRCGGHITLANLQYFNFDVENVKCYECQKK